MITNPEAEGSSWLVRAIEGRWRRELDVGGALPLPRAGARHERAALMLVMTHGWSGSVGECAKVIGPFTDPVAHGGPSATD
jgi:hypothetical protein